MKTFREVLQNIVESCTPPVEEAAGVAGPLNTSSHKVYRKGVDSLANKDNSASRKVKMNIVKKEKKLDNQAKKSSK